jgi:hypothetical protein
MMLPARRILAATIVCGTLAAALAFPWTRARAANEGQPTDWHRFYYYPYVYYPQNFQPLQSFDHMYHRYPPERRIPVYNKSWHNFYPSPMPYHKGHHFILDVF